MSDQGALFGITVPPGLRLGDRQWIALAQLGAQPETSAALGEHIHRKRGCDYCANDLECFYAEADGAHVAASLRKHGLVRFSRKRGVWYLVETGLPPESASADQEIPF